MVLVVLDGNRHYRVLAPPHSHPNLRLRPKLAYAPNWIAIQAPSLAEALSESRMGCAHEPVQACVGV